MIGGVHGAAQIHGGFRTRAGGTIEKQERWDEGFAWQDLQVPGISGISRQGRKEREEARREDR